jgi:hypothetical protein
MKPAIILSLIFLTWGSVMAGGDKLFKGGAGIAGHYIAMPVGKILLIKKNDIKITLKFLINGEEKKGTFSKFEYDLSSRPQRVSGVIWMRAPSTGFFANVKGLFVHDSFQYADKLQFDGIKLFAHPAGLDHSSVYFWTSPNEPDVAVRMAPTPWTSFGQVNWDDPNVVWFVYDEKREWRVIPIDKIWD